MKSFVWNGIIYPSLKEAAAKLHLSYHGVLYRQRRGLTSDSELWSGTCKPVTIDGITYTSQHAAAQALGVADATISIRVKRLSQTAKLVS